VDAVTVEPVGEFALKGITRPLAAYNAAATKSADSYRPDELAMPGCGNWRSPRTTVDVPVFRQTD
jgi:hypothetical protein